MGNGNDSRNSIHMYIDDRLQAFVAHQEATVIFVVHKQVFRQHCRAHRITDNRTVGITVRIVILESPRIGNLCPRSFFASSQKILA